MTNFDVGNGERGKKWIENEEMQRVNLSSFPHSLSISLQPGCQDATICAILGYKVILCLIGMYAYIYI